MARGANKGFYVEVKGINETIKKINVFQTKKIIQVKSLIKDTAQKVQKEGRSRAPKLTGDTKISVKSKYYDNGLYATIKPRLPKGYKAHWHEYGTVKMAARPFMAPAEQSVESSYNSKLKSIINGDEVI